MKDKELVLRYVAERLNGKEADEAMGKLRKINPTYHWCFEYDGMVICDTDIEYENCLCHRKK